jgi:hypothetical protein
MKKITISTPYRVNAAKDMSRTELTRWFSLLNMLKFINLGEQICGVKKSEDEISHNCLLRYVDTVSGDLEKYLDEWQGVPYKYSLNPRHSESKSLEEIDFVFHQ